MCLSHIFLLYSLCFLWLTDVSSNLLPGLSFCLSPVISPGDLSLVRFILPTAI